MGHVARSALRSLRLVASRDASFDREGIARVRVLFGGGFDLSALFARIARRFSPGPGAPGSSYDQAREVVVHLLRQGALRRLPQDPGPIQAFVLAGATSAPGAAVRATALVTVIYRTQYAETTRSCQRV